MRLGVAVAALATAALVINSIWLNESPVLTHLLPMADVILWGNFELPAAALLAGAAWATLRTPIWQRVFILAALLFVGIWREFEPFVGQPPAIGPARWTQQICRQSSTSSCSAAAAATLLQIVGIHATEAEMIHDCLTHVGGTSTLGLYRGLSLKTVGSRWAARVDDLPADAIDRLPTPAIVTIKMVGGSGLLGAFGHSVVVFGRTAQGNFDVGDPFAGRQMWTRHQLAQVFAGEVFTLIPRT